MKLIEGNYQMPPFARIQWASKEIKEKYEPMWETAKKFFLTMEKLSVMHGLRGATTDSVQPSYLLSHQQRLLSDGLYFLPFKKVGNYTGRASAHPPVSNEQDLTNWHYYGCITRDIEAGRKFLEADEGLHTNGEIDHKTIGKLLGFPECCIDSFQELFVNKGINDTTWEKASKTPEKFIKSKEGNVLALQNIPWQMNNLFSPFHVMTHFQMACSFYCEQTLKIANEWIALSEKSNIRGLKEVELFLRMPCEWDCYKGIAYIKTPLFKVSMNSAFTAERYVIRIEGSYFPLDAPRGLTFPWDNQTRMRTIAKNENQLIYGGEG